MAIEILQFPILVPCLRHSFEQTSPGLPVHLFDYPANEAVTCIPGDLSSGVLVLCDHASNAMPPEYAGLGLPSSERERHIAYDIGAAGVTRALAQALGGPALLTRYSRLLIDPNRGRDDPTLVMRLSDGAVVPGNARIGTDEIADRVRRFYDPYDAAIAAALAAFAKAQIVPVILSIHSFTPVMKGVIRPWHIGVLWDNDPRLNLAFLEILRREPDLFVGDNEPYDGALEGDVIDRHATRHGLANALIELRQDLIAHDDDAKAWGLRLAAFLKPLLDDPILHERKHYPSRVGRQRFLPKSQEAAMAIDPNTMQELEAMAFRRLIQHLRDNPQVQNIDMMNLAGFCRNCLSNWLQDAAKDKNITLEKDTAREHVYGMPYEEWKARHQTQATQAQQDAFAKNAIHKHG